MDGFIGSQTGAAHFTSVAPPLTQSQPSSYLPSVPSHHNVIQTSMESVAPPTNNSLLWTLDPTHAQPATVRNKGYVLRFKCLFLCLSDIGAYVFGADSLDGHIIVNCAED